jgi:hypothetical protein
MSWLIGGNDARWCISCSASRFGPSNIQMSMLVRVEVFSKYVNYNFECFIYLDVSNCMYKYKYLLQANQNITTYSALHFPCTLM